MAIGKLGSLPRWCSSAIGLLAVPRIVRLVIEPGAQAETIVVASIGHLLRDGLLGADAAGYSVALGAFLAGSLVAESGKGREVEHLVEPIRDLFAAVFFVSVGLMIDPLLALDNWRSVVALSLLVIVGKLISVSIGAFVTGGGARTSIQAGMAVTQIGEFSFIIAGLGLTLGATRPFLYTVAVAVSAVTTLTTPFLIAWSGGLAAFVDRKLPHALQTYTALYGAWVERLTTSRYKRRSVGAWRVVQLLLLDTVLLAALVIIAAFQSDLVFDYLSATFGLGVGAAWVTTVVLAAAVAAPLVIGP